MIRFNGREYDLMELTDERDGPLGFRTGVCRSGGFVVIAQFDPDGTRQSVALSHQQVALLRGYLAETGGGE